MSRTHPAQSDPRQAQKPTLSAARREAGRISPEIFARAYLPAHLRLPPSRMHTELFARLGAAAVEERGLRLAVAAPRGHAKSTIVSLAYVLWCVCYGLEPFIVVVSATGDQAADLLANVKRELEGNGRLLEDFPGVCEPPGVRPPAERWRKDDIVTRSGVKVRAIGPDGKIRGRKHAQHRPSLIILDDVEHESQARSAEQRDSLRRWFERAALKSGSSTTNVVVAGTILHYDSLLARLIDPKQSPGWARLIYRAVMAFSPRHDLWGRWESVYCTSEEHEGRSGPTAAREFFEANRDAMLEGTGVLWPEREDYYVLMEVRVREGRASFDAEKQNEPVNPEECYFPEEEFVFWDDPRPGVEGCADAAALLAALGKQCTVFGACDPSLGKAGRNRDDTAIVTIVRHDPTGVLYVLDADIARRKPDEIIETVIGYQRLRGCALFAVEANQFQDFLADEMRRRSAAEHMHVPVKKVTHTGDKLGRVQRLQPLIKSGTLRLSRRHAALLDQLRRFPLHAHDDGPDALEMAVALATRPGVSAQWVGAGSNEPPPIKTFAQMRAEDPEWGWTEVRCQDDIDRVLGRWR